MATVRLSGSRACAGVVRSLRPLALPVSALFLAPALLDVEVLDVVLPDVVPLDAVLLGPVPPDVEVLEAPTVAGAVPGALVPETVPGALVPETGEAGASRPAEVVDAPAVVDAGLSKPAKPSGRAVGDDRSVVRPVLPPTPALAGGGVVEVLPAGTSLPKVGAAGAGLPVAGADGVVEAGVLSLPRGGAAATGASVDVGPPAVEPPAVGAVEPPIAGAVEPPIAGAVEPPVAGVEEPLVPGAGEGEPMAGAAAGEPALPVAGLSGGGAPAGLPVKGAVGLYGGGGSAELSRKGSTGLYGGGMSAPPASRCRRCMSATTPSAQRSILVIEYPVTRPETNVANGLKLPVSASMTRPSPAISSMAAMTSRVNRWWWRLGNHLSIRPMPAEMKPPIAAPAAPAIRTSLPSTEVRLFSKICMRYARICCSISWTPSRMASRPVRANQFRIRSLNSSSSCRTIC
ncbi:hypothetical protein [Micromonospora profundi]|uniref:hypothetical protein n=1 Tax=Micromonospora profundi TaxID=1420889 RepID=UPI0036825401